MVLLMEKILPTEISKYLDTSFSFNKPIPLSAILTKIKNANRNNFIVSIGCNKYLYINSFYPGSFPD